MRARRERTPERRGSQGTAGQTQALLGYTQSDEISLVWLGDTPENEPLFGGKVHKLTSVLASLTAAHFQLALTVHFDRDQALRLSSMAPHFDARVLQLPSKAEAANMFLWRAMDARKNSISMAAQAHFPQEALSQRNQRDVRAMLADKGIDFEIAYPAAFKWGTWVRRTTLERALTPEELARIPEPHRPVPGTRVRRSNVDEITMPEFHTVTNRLEVIFDSAEPCT